MSKIVFTTILKVGVAHGQNNGIVGNKLLLTDIKHESELDSFVILGNSLHKKIFGKYKKDYLRTVSVVKIKADTGKTIYREFQGKNLSSGMVALTQNSIKWLTKYDNNGNGTAPVRLTLSPGYKLPYYWKHPDKAIRISFRLGFISVILGVISLIVAFKDELLSIF